MWYHRIEKTKQLWVPPQEHAIFFARERVKQTERVEIVIISTTAKRIWVLFEKCWKYRGVHCFVIDFFYLIILIFLKNLDKFHVIVYRVVRETTRFEALTDDNVSLRKKSFVSYPDSSFFASIVTVKMKYSQNTWRCFISDRFWHSDAYDQVAWEKRRRLKVTRANFERMFFFFFVLLSYSFRQVIP